jgi:DNA-binding beta-propeller fold protein YncE
VSAFSVLSSNVAPRRARLAPLAGLGAVLAVALSLAFASSAAAAVSYPFVGQLEPASGSFGSLEPNGIAVDQASGQTYAADSEAQAVDVFETSTGDQLAGLDGSLTPAGGFGARLSVAADDATGDVFVLDSADDVVDEFDSGGAYICQITGAAIPSASECNGLAGSETPSGAFSNPDGIAVDQATGEIYVGDAADEVLDVFGSGGEYLRQISLAPVAGELAASEPQGLAVSDFNGRVYLTNVVPAAVFVFDAAGSFVETMSGADTPAGSFGAAAIVAVAVQNSSGRIFVATTDSESPALDVFDAEGAYLPVRFGRSFTHPLGLGFDQAGGILDVGDVPAAPLVIGTFGPAAIVPDVTTSAPGAVGPHGATLNGSVGPDEIPLTECFFEWGTSTSYDHTAACVPAAGAIPADSAAHPVSAELSGLQAGTTYHYRLVAANANGADQGADELLETPPPPAIGGVEAIGLTPSGADLVAQIDPQGFDTTYRFEYGTDVSYGTSIPVPDGDIGSGSGPVAVSQHVSGLTAGTTYHFRVVATNADGTTTSADHVFVFLAPEGGQSCPNEALRTGLSAALPECRAYEMVTPVQKNGALIGALTFGPVPDVSAAGDGLILGADQCFGEVAACTAERVNSGTPYRFSRGEGGWGAAALSPSAEAFEVNTWWNYDADTRTSLFSMPTERDGGDVFYAREPDGSFQAIGPLAPPRPDPGFRAVEAIISIAMTPDASHVVYTNDSVWPFSSGEPSKSLYEYVGRNNTAPLLVAVSGGQGSHDLISACGSQLGELEVLGSALSEDGRTVYFTSEHCPEGTGANDSIPVPVEELFARVDNESADAHTVAISQPLALPGGLPDAGCTTTACRENIEVEANWRSAGFQRASGDGSKAFFLSPQQLTDDAGQDPEPSDHGNSAGCSSTTGTNGCNLYLYDLDRPPGHNLLDVSSGALTPAGPQVQGVLATSPDGSHVYFVAKGVLTAQANPEGRHPVEGADNLYVYERDGAQPDGRLSFISDLLEADHDSWQNADQIANVTPDGRYLVFTSHAALTPDVTRTDGAAQVYRYDALSQALTRISVGERGFNDDGNGGAGDATIVPGLAGYRHADVRSDPTMSDEGSRVSFMSSVALVPGALESVLIGQGPQEEPEYAQNVYEWHDGQVSLISDGRDTSSQPAELCASPSSVCLIGADRSGQNVFFGTADPLVTGDTDTQEDFYDARVDGGFATAPQPAPCEGEGCKGPPNPAPTSSSPGSSTFSGPPDPAPKRAKKKQKHKKHHKKKQHKKKHHNAHQKGSGAKHSSRESGGQK